MFLGWGPREGPREHPLDEYAEPGGGTPASMAVVGGVLVAGLVAAGRLVRPGRRLHARGRALRRPGRPTPVPCSTGAPSPVARVGAKVPEWFDWLCAGGGLLGAFGVAAFGLWGRPGPWPARAVRPLAALHSGRVGDYTAWLALGAGRHHRADAAGGALGAGRPARYRVQRGELSREVLVSVRQAIRVSRISRIATCGRPGGQLRSHSMSSQTFADLGVSSAVLDALATRGINEPFPVQRLVVPDVLAGPRRARQVPHGLGQDAGLRRPDGGPHRGQRPARPPRWSWPRPASSPARSWRSCARWLTPARCRSPPSTAAPASTAGQAGLQGPHRGGHARAASRTCIDRGAVSLEHEQHPRARRGRPDARHGLPARRRPDRRA